jgi:sterol desaturase/sphingolipid hydroxylase (fatty acid hydroxylase superfamily)
VTSPQPSDPHPSATDSPPAQAPVAAGFVSGVDHLPTHWGSGWISGVLSIGLGVVSLGAVLCLHYPSLLTMPELRGQYPLLLVRGLLFAVLIASFVLGLLSVWLRERKVLGLTGLLLALAAMLLGGGSAPVGEVSSNSPFLGLDWFLLNLIFFSLVFVPLERLFARLPNQPVFRREWQTDLSYFLISSLLVQTTTYLTLKPAGWLFGWAELAPLQGAVRVQPFWLQLIEVLLVTDLTQYWVHRLFHRIPLLWRFHAIHHSAEIMDWLAGSRLHLVDVIVTRGLSYVPVYWLGFGDPAVYAYIAIVSLQATFIHANVRFEFGLLKWVVATPQFHHWHHSAEREALDKNFSVHLPIWDWLFGTLHLPNRWPDEYGLAGGKRLPPGYLRQLLLPFLASSQVHNSDGGVERHE